MGKEKTPIVDTPVVIDSNFKLTRGKIKQMYKDDTSVRRNVGKDTLQSSSINNLTSESLSTRYFNLTTDLATQREYSQQAYLFYPVYANYIDSLSNMFCWRYVYTPRLVKEKNNTDYAEMYNLMGEVVEGLSIESTFPMVLTKLFIDGAVYLTTTKNTSSKTIATLTLPAKRCRPAAITQFGTTMYQFDFAYFESLGLNAAQLEEIFTFYPEEFKVRYNAYLQDKTNLRWQVLDPKYSGAILMNEQGFPTKLHLLFSLIRYGQYLDNELERNSQQLDKIVTHKMPTWEDKLVVGIEEMTELHQSMAKIIAKNKHIRLLTSFGDIKVQSIGEDQSKENKTLNNAYNAIYDEAGTNHSVFNGDNKEAQLYAILREKSTINKYVQQLCSFYSLVLNNSFNFKGYQCDLTVLPITVYDESDMLEVYRQSATLGVGKLEFIVASGVKQINIPSKLALEDYLKLDQLKPLSTSYTQNDSSKTATVNKPEKKEEEKGTNTKTEQEVEQYE